MFAYDMNHQLNLEPDFVSTMGTQNSFSNNNFKIDLLVKQQILKISKTTSDPKRANELINEYMGIQSENQTVNGHLWFMRSMLFQDIFPHEVHILARKIVYGYK